MQYGEHMEARWCLLDRLREAENHIEKVKEVVISRFRTAVAEMAEYARIGDLVA